MAKVDLRCPVNGHAMLDGHAVTQNFFYDLYALSGNLGTGKHSRLNLGPYVCTLQT